MRRLVETHPLDRPPETFLQTNDGDVREECAGAGEIRLRVAHVAQPRIAVDRLGIRGAGERPHNLEEPVQRDALAGGDVDDLSARLRCIAGAKHAIDHIGHVREVAGLLTVAIDRRAAAVEQRFDEE